MSTEYISIRFKTSPEKSEIISALLLDEGFEGVEERENETIISIKSDLWDEALLDEIMKEYEVDYSFEKIEQQNWNAQWESSFEPVVIGNFATIRASFHEQVKHTVHEIIITPKMSFGTGHHATTYLMIEQMQGINFYNKTVIDFGTGTGVLAILAEKLGANKIIATDNDEWSIRNAHENIQANECSKIELVLADNLPVNNLPKADVILANINLNVILANLEVLQSIAKSEATFLFSGLMAADEEQIVIELQNRGFYIKNVFHRNGWICLNATC